MPLPKDHCYVIAEVGSTHMGDLRKALQAISVAARVGADAVKFQLFRLEDILVDATQGDRRTEMPPGWVPMLARRCKARNVDFLCTPFAAWAVDVLKPWVWAWKIGSFERNRQDIWDACRATKKPIIASEGLGTVEADYRLYCVSKYPARQYDMFIGGIMNGSGTVGLSDHTRSTVLPALAVARGARIVEKHFRPWKTLRDCPDYKHSLDPKLFKRMIRNIRMAEQTCWREEPERQIPTYPNRRLA